MAESFKRQNQTVSVLQASMDSPPLARLAELTRDSSARLKALLPLLPGPMQAAITAGPIDGPAWCLLVDNSAVAAKLRQMIPALVAHLRSLGWDVQEIRLKVHNPRSR